MENHTGTLIEKTNNYTKVTTELYKLKLIEKSADVIAHLLEKIVLFTAVISLFTMINIGIAIYIGEMLSKLFLGFFVVALFYLILALLLYFAGKILIKKPVKNSIIKEALK